MSNTIQMELHEEIVTDLQYKVEELERENDGLIEEIEDIKEEYKDVIKDLEKKITKELEERKCKEYDERDENYNFGIEVCICHVEDIFKALLNKLK